MTRDEIIQSYESGNRDFRGANLRYANLRGANLRDADLRYADIRYADLRNTRLRGADLRGADIRDADLGYADLRGADLGYADLRDVNLLYVNFRDTNLRGTNLRGTNLTEAIGLEQQVVCNDGSITGYKKTDSGIVVLEIPRSARRVNAYGSRKCRAEYAVVVEAPENARSFNDSDFVYTVGETVRPDSFDPDPRVECSHGIHFFVTRKEAEEY